MEKKRPTSITVIAWIFIIIFGFTIVLNSMVLMGFITTVKQARPDFYSPLKDMPEEAKIFMQLLNIVFYVFVLISGIQFLKMRAWARTALEGISWFSLFFTVIGGIISIFGWIRSVSAVPSPEIPTSPPIFKYIVLVALLFAYIVFLALYIIIIKFLRSKTIREAVTQSGGSSLQNKSSLNPQ